MNNILNEHFKDKTFDLRIDKYSCWFDQKITPDVFCIVSQVITYYKDEVFSITSLRKNIVAKELIDTFFSKPNLDTKSNNEYDKFFSQPVKLLEYAQIIVPVSKKRGVLYKIENFELLELISKNERNANVFLYYYLLKVLKDSDFYSCFEEFYSNQTNTSLRILKNKFCEFMVFNTNKRTQTECNRIFNKILNIISYNKKTKGTVKGNLSKDAIVLEDIRYNRKNSRDINVNKPKDVPRKEYIVNIDDTLISRIEKAKKKVKDNNIKNYNGLSELSKEECATQGHHIFPKSDFVDIADFCENIIVITAAEHFGQAHPNGNTNIIDYKFQYECIIAKIMRIKEDLLKFGEESIYSFNRLLLVLNCGFKTQLFNSIKHMDFDSILILINENFNQTNIEKKVG